jgi:hypothetical protein
VLELNFLYASATKFSVSVCPLITFSPYLKEYFKEMDDGWRVGQMRVGNSTRMTIYRAL